MKKTMIALATAGLGLVGCGGDTQTVSKPAAAPELYFAYPADTPVMADGQPMFTTAVPVSAPVFLRFTDRITTPESDIADALILKDDQGNSVTLESAMLTAGDKGLAVKPAEALSPGRVYTLTADGLEVAGQAVSLTDDGIVFRTEPSSSGPLLSQTEGVDFRVARLIPLGDDRYPATDLSVLRVQFTEPVKASTVVYGETFSLLDSEGELVPAEVYLRGHRLTVDPDDYLDPAQTYSIEVTDGIQSDILGANLTVPAEAPWTFQPMDTRSPNGERQFAAQKAADSEGLVAISGAEFNTVNLQSKLLGDNNPTTAGGVVFAELGYIPRFERVGKSVPLAIGRGSLMTGSSVVINVAGAVPAGFESEDVSVRFISDANGFLMPNPYTDAEDAPRLVELYIDMALNADNPVANAAFAQQLMHVQLVGTAIVEDGTLTIEAVGVIEPGVMGVDQASGLISFRLEGFRFEKDAPSPEQFADQEAPFIKGLSPGSDYQNRHRPGDPVVIYVSEPVTPNSVNGDTVKLFADGVEQSVEVQLNGSAIKIQPTEPLKHQVQYSVMLDGPADTSGNLLATTSLDFNLAPTEQGTPSEQSPLLLTTMPGYPCAKTGASPGDDHQGRCAGGKSTDDLLPIAALAKDQSILVRFSQNMDPATFIPGNTLNIEKQNDDNSWSPLPASNYDIEVQSRALIIRSVAGWDEGARYRYTLNDQGSLRSMAGLPLQAIPLSQGKEEPGNRTFGTGPVVNYFVATDKVDELPLPLRNLPTADANADLEYIKGLEDGSQNGEALPNSIGLTTDENGSVSAINDSTLVEAANVGCAVGEDCPEDQFIYLTAMLDTAVSSMADDTGRVGVDIFPAVLATTSTDVWVSLDTSFVDAFPDFILSVDLEPDEAIPTGPMFMRIRYEEDNEGNKLAPKGFIFSDENGQLTFETTLNVYLDAPYLNPSIGPADLNHNLRSYPIDDLTIRGPITFLEDGRMQISLNNIEPVAVNVEVRGNINITAENTGGLCALPFISGLCGGIANLAIDANTRIHLVIPPDKLNVTYLSPFTQ